MKQLSLIAAVAALAAAAIPVAGSSGPTVKQFHLTAQNGSGQDGTVTLLGKADDTTIVRVRVSNPGDAPEPAHIHVGPCDKLNPAPKYPLTPLVNGTSTTTVNQPMSALVGHDFAVNVHKSAKEASVYVACGNLT